MILKRGVVLGGVFGSLFIISIELSNIINLAFNLSTPLMNLLGWKQ